MKTEKKSKKTTIKLNRVLLFSLILFFVSCTHKNQEDVETPIDVEDLKALNLLIEDGDFIVKRGKGEISRIIVNRLKEKKPFSHCGIIVKEKDSLYIIHSVAREISGKDGVQTIGLLDFLDDSYTGSVFLCRIKSADRPKEQISLNAKEFLKKRTPFDYEFDYKNDESVYCSELVYAVLLNVYQRDYFIKSNIDNKEILTFNSLIDTSDFKIIPIK